MDEAISGHPLASRGLLLCAFENQAIVVVDNWKK